MSRTIELGSSETDINIVLPDGKIIQLQYRLETPSIDICLPEECLVINWKGDDMEPARQHGKYSHIRMSKQLVIELDPQWINECEGE